MWRRPSASQKYAPCARCTKRGVPPTARKARTGELTPPGMMRRARANSCWLRSVLGVMRGHVQDLEGLGFFVGEFLGLALRLGPEQAGGGHVAHAGAKARIEAAIQVGEGFGGGRGQVAAAGDQGREGRRQRVAGAGKDGFEALELLVAQDRLWRGQHVVDELVR